MLLSSCPAPLPHPHLGPIFQVHDGLPTSYPSLLSHLTSMYLNTPVFALPVAKKQPPGLALRSFHPLASSLPCDFHLLNLRSLQAKVSVPRSTLPPGPDGGLSASRHLPIPALPSGQRCCCSVSPAETSHPFSPSMCLSPG